MYNRLLYNVMSNVKPLRKCDIQYLNSYLSQHSWLPMYNVQRWLRCDVKLDQRFFFGNVHFRTQRQLYDYIVITLKNINTYKGTVQPDRNGLEMVC